MAFPTVCVVSPHRSDPTDPLGHEMEDVVSSTPDELEGREELFKYVPLHELRSTDIIKLSMYLNQPGQLDGDCMNDYRGLAENVGFTYYEIKKFERQDNCTSALFDEWIQVRTDLEPTLWNLWRYLTTMNRSDILYDMEPTFVDCAKKYHNRPIGVEPEPAPPVVERVVYDAFVIWAIGPTEKQFLSEMTEWLETKYNLLLYVPGRDDTPGEITVEEQSTVMSKRCRRCIALLSRSKCPHADFLIKQAKSIAPSGRTKFLIPVIIEQNVSVPQFLRDLQVCDFSIDVDPRWRWQQLVCVIRSNKYATGVKPAKENNDDTRTQAVTSASDGDSGIVCAESEIVRSDSVCTTSTPYVSARNNVVSENSRTQEYDLAGNNVGSENSKKQETVDPLREIEKTKSKASSVLKKVSNVCSSVKKRMKKSSGSKQTSVTHMRSKDNKQQSDNAGSLAEVENSLSRIVVSNEVPHDQHATTKSIGAVDDPDSSDSDMASRRRLPILESRELVEATQSASSDEWSDCDLTGSVRQLVNRRGHILPGTITKSHTPKNYQNGVKEAFV